MGEQRGERGKDYRESKKMAKGINKGGSAKAI